MATDRWSACSTVLAFSLLRALSVPQRSTMSVEEHREQLEAMKAALESGNLKDVKRCLDAGVDPAENVAVLLEANTDVEEGENEESEVVAVGTLRFRDFVPNAHFTVLHLAVLLVHAYPLEPVRLKIVQELLSRNPDSIVATTRHFAFSGRSSDNEVVPLENGLNLPQFSSRFAKFIDRPLPEDMHTVLVDALAEYQCMRCLPLKLLEYLHGDDSLADVQIRCSDGTTMIPAHKNILTTASPYFRSLLGERWNDANNEVWDSHVSPTVMLAIKQFIYKGGLPFKQLTEEELHELFVKSHQFQLLDLFHRCEKHLIRLLSLKTFEASLILAGLREQDAKDLYDACVAFFKEHWAHFYFDDESSERLKAAQPDVWLRLKASVLPSASDGDADGADDNE